jgi:hypothetical protein
LNHERFFSTGLDEIHHHLPMGYYQILRAPTPVCSRLVSLGDEILRFKNDDFLQVLRGKSSLLALPAPEPDILRAEPIDDDDDEMLPLEELAIQAAALGIMDPQLELPPPITLNFADFGELTVKFTDSHSSGNRRGVIKCPKHDDCNAKYRYTRAYDNHTHCAAWLFAWATAPRDVASGHHYHCFVPSAASVGEIRGRMPMP